MTKFPYPRRPLPVYTTRPALAARTSCPNLPDNRIPPPGTARGAAARSVGQTHFDAPLVDPPLVDPPLADAPLADAPLVDAPWVPPSGDGAPRTVGAPPAADSGSGRGLLTCGDIADGAVDAPVDGTAGAGLAAACGVLVSGDGSRPGPNTKTCPTEMRKSAPMLFHRAKSRKSRSWRQAML